MLSESLQITDSGSIRAVRLTQGPCNMIIVVSLEDETSPKNEWKILMCTTYHALGSGERMDAWGCGVIFWDRIHGSQFVTVTPVFYYCSFRNSPGAYVLLVREFRFRLLIRIQTAHIYIHVLSSCYYIISHLTSIHYYHLNNLKMPVEFSRTLTFTRYVAHWCQLEQFVYTNLCFQQRHRLAYPSASSSLQFLHIEC